MALFLDTENTILCITAGIGDLKKHLQFCLGELRPGCGGIDKLANGVLR